MPQSLVKNYVHIVFSTKYRQPFIAQKFENELHKYLGGICNSHECYPIKIGGYDDHVHVVCSLSRKIAMMDFIEHLKSSSSKWFKTIDESLRNFYWQDGYFAVSVNPADLDMLVRYVENQREHHTRWTFKDELRINLDKNDMPYDERYLWD
jgi:putative transposase